MPSVKIENTDNNNAITMFQGSDDDRKQVTMGAGHSRTVFVPTGGLMLTAGAPIMVSLTADPSGDVALGMGDDAGILAAGAMMTVEVGPDAPVTLAPPAGKKKAA